MPSAAEIKEAIQLLSKQQLKELYQLITEIMSMSMSLNNLNKETSEIRFANGKACVHCGSTSVVKYGKFGESQPYCCKECKKTFSTLTFSSLSYVSYL